MRKKILFVTIMLLAAVLLSGCVGSTTWPGLSAANEVAYLANTSAVHAIDVTSGKELWSFAGEKFIPLPVVSARTRPHSSQRPQLGVGDGR
jgi:hypothetical protein